MQSNSLSFSVSAQLQFILATLLLAFAASASPLSSQTSMHGPLMIVGGGTQPAALVREFVTLAGGPGKARIIVIAMASASGEKSGASKAQDLAKLGANASNLWFAREHADDDSIVAQLDSATGIWFGGGDQNRLIAVVRGTRVETAIRARWNKGAVVGGTSAGAAVLSTPMITGTELGDSRDTSEAWTRIERASVQVDSGFGFITNAIIDQHFVRRKRSNRLLSLVLSSPPHLGAGVDEGTAIIVAPNGTWRVMGRSVVIIYDARTAERNAGSPLAAKGIQMQILADGMTFDPRR